MIDLDRIAQGYRLAMTVIDDLAAALPSHERATFREETLRKMAAQIEKNCIDHGLTTEQAELAVDAIVARAAEITDVQHPLVDIEPHGHA